MSNPEAALLREVSRVQHDKTIQAVRDLIDSLPVTTQADRSWETKPRSAGQFRDDLVRALRKMREDER